MLTELTCQGILVNMKCIACGKPSEFRASTFSGDWRVITIDACSIECLNAFERRVLEARKPPLNARQKIANLDPSFWGGFNAWI